MQRACTNRERRKERTVCAHIPTLYIYKMHWMAMHIWFIIITLYANLYTTSRCWLRGTSCVSFFFLLHCIRAFSRPFGSSCWPHRWESRCERFLIAFKCVACWYSRKVTQSWYVRGALATCEMSVLDMRADLANKILHIYIYFYIRARTVRGFY